MKKKTMAFGGLLMAVAMTGYSVAGTYAKYISSIDITDNARVARWNFTVNGDTDNKVELDLFASSYECKNIAGKNCVQALNKSTDVTLGTDSTENVVAPGTSGKAKIQLSIDSEVAYKLSFANAGAENTIVLSADEVKAALNNNTTLIDSLKTAKLLEEDGSYSPVKFNLTATPSNGNSQTVPFKLNTLADTMNSVIDTFKANETLKDRYLLDAEKMVFKPVSKGSFATPLEISWNWAFEATTSETVTEDMKHAIDLLDTALVKEITTTDGETTTSTPRNIKFALTINAEQYGDSKQHVANN